eukprot:365334-Chlamydomonas_euryale.AAC.10
MDGGLGVGGRGSRVGVWGPREEWMKETKPQKMHLPEPGRGCGVGACGRYEHGDAHTLTIAASVSRSRSSSMRAASPALGVDVWRASIARANVNCMLRTATQQGNRKRTDSGKQRAALVGRRRYAPG